MHTLWGYVAESCNARPRPDWLAAASGQPVDVLEKRLCGLVYDPATLKQNLPSALPKMYGKRKECRTGLPATRQHLTVCHRQLSLGPDHWRKLSTTNSICGVILRYFGPPELTGAWRIGTPNSIFARHSATRATCSLLGPCWRRGNGHDSAKVDYTHTYRPIPK